jgi:hypothetical protein
MKKFWLACTVAGVALVAAQPSPVEANCVAGTFNLVSHQFGGFFQNCADAAPVSGFIWSVGGAATHNSGTTDVICEDLAGETQTQSCVFTGPAADISQPGDGLVTVQFDYGNPGTFPGCPNPNSDATGLRQVIQVSANDGSSLLASVGWSDIGLYLVDAAHPATGGPLSCTHTEAGLSVLSFDGTTLRARVPSPKVYTDCDPGSLGADVLGSCNPTTVPTSASGRLYQTMGRCGQYPSPLLASGWTFLADASSGEAVATVPRSDLADTCTFVGASGIVGGNETLATVGILQIAGLNAPPPKALNVLARRAGNEIVLSWRTAAEFSLLGFDVLADLPGKKGRVKLNDNLIAAQGGVTGAGASYEHRIPTSRLQGAKTLIIQSVLSTGATLLSDPASF